MRLKLQGPAVEGVLTGSLLSKRDMSSLALHFASSPVTAFILSTGLRSPFLAPLRLPLTVFLKCLPCNSSSLSSAVSECTYSAIILSRPPPSSPLSLYIRAPIALRSSKHVSFPVAKRRVHAYVFGQYASARDTSVGSSLARAKRSDANHNN